jgi:hypothetical protein
MSGTDTSIGRRRSPNAKEKLAASLLEIMRLRGTPLDRNRAKRMTPAEIVGLFHFDHDAGFACHGADNHPTRITPRPVREHIEKTAKIDIPAIAKCRRVSAEQIEFQRKLLAKAGQLAEIEAARRRNRTIPSRPLPCGRRSAWKKPLGAFRAIRRDNG